MNAPDVAFDSFATKWLHSEPEQETVALFLDPALRRRAQAFGCLVHELASCAFADSEPQVVAAKLHWWCEELAVAVRGGARHPVTRRLFDDDRVVELDAGLWQRLAEGALVQLDAGVASDLAQLRAGLEAFYAPVATIDLALSCAATDARRNADLWVGAHLLRQALHPELARAVPLDLLARHGATRTQLQERDAAKRPAVVRDLFAAVDTMLEAALAGSGRASLGRLVRARLDRARLRAALDARDPEAEFARRDDGRWRTAWTAWRAARDLARRDPAALGRNDA